MLKRLVYYNQATFMFSAAQQQQLLRPSHRLPLRTLLAGGAVWFGSVFTLLALAGVLYFYDSNYVELYLARVEVVRGGSRTQPTSRSVAANRNNRSAAACNAAGGSELHMMMSTRDEKQ